MGPDTPLRRTVLWRLAPTAGAAVVLAWMAVPWAWSTIDDPGHALALRSSVEALGPLEGTWTRFREMFYIDLEWGLFRPVYWLYAAAFYWLPSSLAHGLRLLMLVVAVVGPAVYFARTSRDRDRRIFTVLLVVAGCSTVTLGLFFVSLQELSGVAFVGIGLLARGRLPRILAWTAAAWFKVPFAWLLVGYSLVLWRQGARRDAIVSAGAGFGSLAMAVVMARNGSYTADYALNPIVMWENIPKLLEYRNAYLLVMFIWWAALAGRRLNVSNDTLLFGTALAGYTLQMLPWGVTAYYGGPISYFLALTLVTLVGEGVAQPRWRRVVALAMPVGLAILLMAWPVRQVLQSNTVVRGLSDCLTQLPGSRTALGGDLVYVTSSPEAPIRILENVRLGDPAWPGEMSLYDPLTWNAEKSTFTHFAAVGPMGIPEGRDGVAVCEAGIATLYELVP